MLPQSSYCCGCYAASTAAAQFARRLPLEALDASLVSHKPLAPLHAQPFCPPPQVVRSAPDYAAAGRDEVALLTSIRGHDPLARSHCVRLLDSFEHSVPGGGPHVCEVFELLGDDLLTLMKWVLMELWCAKGCGSPGEQAAATLLLPSSVTRCAREHEHGVLPFAPHQSSENRFRPAGCSCCTATAAPVACRCRWCATSRSSCSLPWTSCTASAALCTPVRRMSSREHGCLDPQHARLLLGSSGWL